VIFFAPRTADLRFVIAATNEKRNPITFCVILATGGDPRNTLQPLPRAPLIPVQARG